MARPRLSKRFRSRRQTSARTRHVVANYLNDHRLICGQGRLNASMQQCSVGDISILRLKYGVPVRIEPNHRDGIYVAQVPIRGRARVHFPGASFELASSAGALLFPNAPIAVELSSQCEQYILRFPATTLHRFAEAVLDTPWERLREFDQPYILGELASRSLIGLIEHAIFQYSRWTMCKSREVFCRDVEELLSGALLLGGQPHRFGGVAGKTWNLAPKYVRDAEEYMRENIEHPLLLSDIARAVGISVRTLHKVFRDFRGTTPSAVLLDLRLSGARNDLISASQGMRVADVARTWGFSHHGRFSIAYRRKFGEHPSRTIRK